MARKVLLVEDEPNIVEAVSFLLKREGWEVEHQAEGTGTVERIRADTPDLVILDLMLPGMSGLEILRELRADAGFDRLPVLMLTARGQSRDRDMAEKAGVSRFMTKPFSNTEVLTAVRDLVALADRA